MNLVEGLKRWLRWLRILTAFAEDPDSVPRTQVATQPVIPIQRDPTPSSGLNGHCT